MPLKEPFLPHLIRRFLQHTIYDNGFYTTVLKGISLGCPLSSLLGALFLKPLDDAMAKTGLFYNRFMDDWIVLSPTRWKLRRAIAAVNKTLNDLKLDKHPEKTFAGRISAGFDFLGYNFHTVECGRERETISKSSVNIPSGKRREKGTTLISGQTGTCNTNGMDRRAGKHLNNKSATNIKIKKVLLRPAKKTINNFLQKISRLYEQGADRVRIGKYIQQWCKWRNAGLGLWGQGLPFSPIMSMGSKNKPVTFFPFNILIKVIQLSQTRPLSPHRMSGFCAMSNR